MMRPHNTESSRKGKITPYRNFSGVTICSKCMRNSLFNYTLCVCKQLYYLYTMSHCIERKINQLTEINRTSYPLPDEQPKRYKIFTKFCYEMLLTSLILSTFASEIPLIIQSLRRVVICIPRTVHIPADFNFLMSAALMPWACNSSISVKKLTSSSRTHSSASKA